MTRQISPTQYVPLKRCVPRGVLVAEAKRLAEAGARYVMAIGLDRRFARDGLSSGGFEVCHLFARDREGSLTMLSTPLPADDPRLPTIANVVPAANWAERELHDLFGIIAEGHPDPRRLVLADDWPDGIYPLRKDLPHNYRPPRAPGAKPQVRPAPEGSTVVPVGPFFPTLEEPAYFRLFVEGERVVGADYRGFYSHRGIEKLGETLRYDQIPFLAERICGICGFTHSTAFCQAVESAVGLQAPARARYIRTVMLELERIHSHLLWLGLAAHIVGFETAFMQSWRVREPVMWAAEAISGNRKTYGMNLPGGVRRDISRETAATLVAALDEIEREAAPLVESLVDDTALRLRLERVGVLSADQAVKRGVVGPTARASGLTIDIRADFPYAAYPDLVFGPAAVQSGSDIWARLEVRAEELFGSVKLIRQALSEMPDGPLYQEPGPIPPGREGISLVEAPRGQCCHYVLTGLDGKPERWRVLAPTYMQLPAVADMIGPETTVADFPIIAASIDPCFSCTERLEIVRRGAPGS